MGEKDSSIDVVHPDGHSSADIIPGAHDATTLMHRQPGSIGGRPNGQDIPAGSPVREGEETKRLHELEGGGGERG